MPEVCAVIVAVSCAGGTQTMSPKRVWQPSSPYAQQLGSSAHGHDSFGADSTASCNVELTAGFAASNFNAYFAIRKFLFLELRPFEKYYFEANKQLVNVSSCLCEIKRYKTIQLFKRYGVDCKK